MRDAGDTYSMSLQVGKTGGEADFDKLSLRMQKEFKGITITSKVREKKLVPLEIILDLTIRVAAGIAVAAFIKFLEKLWEELRREGLHPQAFKPDDVQASAERYLLSNGVSAFKVMRKVDKGPYVQFIFRDGKGYEHIVVVTSFDLKILSYERKGRK